MIGASGTGLCKTVVREDGRATPFLEGECIMNTTLTRRRTTPRQRKVGAIAAAIAALGLSLSLVGSPAYAAGSFNVKATPGGCTQTDFTGGSSGASGYTQHANVICATSLMVTVQLNRNGLYGAEQQDTGGYVSTTLTGSGTIYGTHRLCVWQALSFWYNCDFVRYT